ncbi:hypothetical protein SUDANB58_04910 [Streptomyces sp. enrichment culture]
MSVAFSLEARPGERLWDGGYPGLRFATLDAGPPVDAGAGRAPVRRPALSGTPLRGR